MRVIRSNMEKKFFFVISGAPDTPLQDNNIKGMDFFNSPYHPEYFDTWFVKILERKGNSR